MNITADSRTFKVVWNVICSFLAKAIVAAVVLAMVPLTLTCLGEYRNGVWLTVSGILVWMDQMDIGLGNGLRNRLAQHMAHEDAQSAKAVVSSTAVMLVIIVVPLALLLSLLIWQCDVWAALGASRAEVPELRVALLAALMLVSGTFVMKFVGNVYMGMQMPSVNNLLLALGQSLALLLTWLLWKAGKADFLAIAVANTAAPLVVWMLSYPITFWRVFPQLRPSLRTVSLRSALELGNLGVKFFWLQVAALIQFSSANLLISHFFTPQMVTPFQVAFRYMGIALTAFSVICMPLWNATTDAYERGDMAWIRGMDRKMNLLMTALVAGLALMVVVSPWVYAFWVGDKTHVPTAMTVLMAFYVFLLVLSMRYSYILNGVGALRLQMYMTVMTVVYIPAAWLASTTLRSMTAFLMVMCLCNLPGIVVNVIQYNKILNGKATGLWKVI